MLINLTSVVNKVDLNPLFIDLQWDGLRPLITCHYPSIPDLNLTHTITVCWQDTLQKRKNRKHVTPRSSNRCPSSLLQTARIWFWWDAEPSVPHFITVLCTGREKGAVFGEAPQLCGLTRGLQPDHKRKNTAGAHTVNSWDWVRRLSRQNEIRLHMICTAAADHMQWGCLKLIPVIISSSCYCTSNLCPSHCVHIKNTKKLNHIYVLFIDLVLSQMLSEILTHPLDNYRVIRCSVTDYHRKAFWSKWSLNRSHHYVIKCLCYYWADIFFFFKSG